MTQNVLIEITSDLRGIETAEAALKQFGDADKAIAEQFAKTNAALKERDKVLDSLQGGLKGLTDSLKQTAKAAAGQFGDKGLKEFKTALIQNTETVGLLGYAIGAAGEKLQTLTKGSAEFEELQAQIADSIKVFNGLTDAEDNTATGAQSLRAKLRVMREELSALENAGKENTDEFLQLAVAAGQVEDQIGDTSARIRAMASDTFATDALIGGIQGVASAFQIAQGAAALFGDEDKDLQLALVKLNAVMAITSGIQQLQNELQRQTSVMIAVGNAQRKIATLSTTLDTAATSTNTLVKYGAIAAQKVLNAVMAASPAGLLLIAIGAVAGAMLYFTSNTDKAMEAQTKLNEQLKIQLDYLEQSDKEFLQPMDARIQKIQDELALMKQRNVSQGAIIEKEQELLRAQTYRAQVHKANVISETGSVEDLTKKISDQLTIVTRLKEEIQVKNDENSIYKFFTRNDKDNRGVMKFQLDDALKMEQDTLDGLQKKKEIAGKATQEADQTSTDLEAKNLEKIKHAREQYIKDVTAGAEAFSARQVQGSQAELTAQLAAIETRRKFAVQAAGLEKGEIAKINADALKSSAELQFNYEQKRMDDASKSLESRAALEFDGSQKRLSLELQALDIQKEKELDTEVVVNGQRVKVREMGEKKVQEVEDRYRKIREDKTRATNLKIAQDEVNVRLAGLSAQASQLEIAGADATSEELLIIKKKQVTESAALERLSIINTTPENSEIRRALLQAANAKELADKKALEKQKRSAEINQDEAYFAAAIGLQIDRDQRVMDSTAATYGQRKKAVENYYAEQNKLIDNASQADMDRLLNGEISLKDYDTKELERLRQKEALKGQIVKTAEEKRAEYVQRSFELGGALLSGYFDALKSGYEDDLANVDSLEKEKLITTKEADKRRRAIKRAEAVADRENALFQVAITTAQNVIKDHLNPVLIGFDLGAFALQTAFIMAKKLPAYRQGKVKIDGPGTETSDSIHAMISRNESVINAEATRRYQPALEAINSLKFEDYLKSLNAPVFHLPAVPVLPKWAEKATTQNSAAIDYEKMAEAIASKIPGTDVRIDKDGIVVIAKEGLQKTEFVNRKYSFKL